MGFRDYLMVECAFLRRRRTQARTGLGGWWVAGPLGAPVL